MHSTPRHPKALEHRRAKHAPETARGSRPTSAPSDWRSALPVLRGEEVLLREVQVSDAPVLHAMLNSDEVTQYISAPPPTIVEFERFIVSMHEQRGEGRAACFGVVPAGCDEAVGLFQIRLGDPLSGVAEWGFAIGWPLWGTGLFEEGAKLVLGFVFGSAGVHRLEARAAEENTRGNAALRKIGATPEGRLRRSLWCRGERVDQIMWSIVRTDWLRAKVIWDGGESLHVH
jgi:ribosomal-protein-alanine N-acetyltransferase